MGPKVLLVHGACHGAWCWQRVIPHLADMGLTARAIDLPGRGGVACTLDDQARAIRAAITGPTVVVAHSAGGFPATAAAELSADNIQALIYLAAFVPKPGQSIAQMRRSAGPDLTLARAYRKSEDGLSFSFDMEQVTALFYHDCPASDLALAQANLCAEPRLPQETALHSVIRALALPRHYIRCTDDRALPPAFQAHMAQDAPAAHRHDLPTGHSPFFAAPAALAAVIARLAS